MDIADKIIAEKTLEENAREAKDLIGQYQVILFKMHSFVKACGGQQQDPVSFCHMILSHYAMQKLESKIITLGK